MRLREIGGANLIYQDEEICIKIKGTGQALHETADFAPWNDTLMETKEWFLHEHSGTPIQILNQSLEGQELSVCYYLAALPDQDVGYVCCSLRHPNVLNLFRQ